MRDIYLVRILLLKSATKEWKVGEIWDKRNYMTNGV